MDDVLREQIDYYRARAGEYDRWWQHWAEDPETGSVWAADLAVVEAALNAFAPTGRVLELACGTGWWTERLAACADELVCVDSSPEVIEIARTRAPHARFVVADLFEWEPTEKFDVVFFSFWLSHVPIDRFDWFWTMVDSALRPGGRAFFIDNLRSPTKLSERFAEFLERDTSPDGIVTRKLHDGTPYRAVKHYYEPADLVARLAALGWSAVCEPTDAFFYYGSAVRDG